MSSQVIFNGGTSGSVTVTCPDVAGSNTMTVPAATDTFAVQSQAVRQVVSTINTTWQSGSNGIPDDNTTPQITEGDEYLSATITPRSATSTLIVNVQLSTFQNGPSTASIIMALFKVGTSNALATTFQTQVAGYVASLPLNYSMTSGTTSAITFKVRAGTQTSGGVNGMRVNGTSGGGLFGGTYTSSLIITEIGG